MTAREASACGCHAGAIAALGVLAWRVSIALHEPLAWRAALAHAGWVFGAALTGKIVGMAVPRLIHVVSRRRDAQRIAS